MTHDPEAAERLAQDAEISMTYRNWRGEVSQRTIRPVALWFGKTDWHPEPGWLLNAWDCGKGERRDFALADCQFTLINTPAPPKDPAGDTALPSVDHLAQIIRTVDGDHTLGAGVLAERILSAIDTPAPPTPAEPAGDALREALTRDLNALRAAASRGPVSSREIFQMTDPMMDRLSLAALAAEPAPIQTAPQPDADEREAMVALVREILRRDVRPKSVADALIAAGWTRKREEG